MPRKPAWQNPLRAASGLASSLFGGPMASEAAAAPRTRYAVELIDPVGGDEMVLGVDSGNEKASARPSFKVFQEPAETPFEGLKVRVWVESMTEGERAPSELGNWCFEVPQQQLELDGLEVGSHSIYAVVTEPSGERPLSEVTRAVINVIVKQDFVPSYKWQEVHSWQTVPAGMEVRLPMGGVGKKWARVPRSWRLQLYVPGEHEGGRSDRSGGSGGNGGGFFVRTDVRAKTTVLELRREIARHPRFGLPIESVRLSLAGTVLEDRDTAYGLGLFTRQRELTPLVDRRRRAP